MAVGYCCARRTARLDCCDGWWGVFRTDGIRNGLSIGWRRCWHNGSTIRASVGRNSWLGANNSGVEYVFGFARNPRLRRRIAPAMRAAKQQYRRTGKPTRVFTEFRYRTRKSWSRARRVIAKAEQIAGKENPRYIVTSLTKSKWIASTLYPQLY